MVVKNDDVFREAIWEVYNKRCFYNRELIENYSDINIDHMLPESLTQEELNEKIENYGLEPDYDLNAIYNLVLACSKCNSLKTDYIPERTTLLNNLTITKSKEPLIKEKMDDIRKNLSKLRLKLRLGAITRDEIDERKIAYLKKEMNDYFEKKIVVARIKLGEEKSNAFKERIESYVKDLKRMSIDDLIKEINDPINSFIGAAREYAQRLFNTKNEIIKF